MNIEYLSFEGGGVKAYAYVGVMKYLCEQKVDLSQLTVISGSSIGAFTALCIVLGHTYEDFSDILSALSLPNFLSFFTILKAIPNLLNYYGIMNLSELTKIVDNVFTRKNVSVDITFRELFKILPIDLVITGSNVNHMRTEYFNHKNTPDMKVKDACIISMSYPILFTPTILENCYFCDGGLFRNLPFQYVELEYEQQLNGIGFFLKEKSSTYQESRNIIEYILCLLNGIYNNSTWSDFQNDKYILDNRICQIPIPSEISSFSITPLQKELLITNGYNAIKDYLSKETSIILRNPHLT
jgi:NTE family protein